MMKKIRILLADDHRLFREGLRAILEQLPEFEIVGEANDGHEALAMAGKFTPDIILLDISMPNLNGIEVARRIAEVSPVTKVIILSMHLDQHYVTESLKAGARGYILKDSAVDELTTAIKNVIGGEIFLGNRVTGVVVSDYVGLAKGKPASAFSILSGREIEVLQLIAEGRSTKEIAADLNVSVKTIETHRKQIMDKLDIHSIAELTRYAIREGIISLD